MPKMALFEEMPMSASGAAGGRKKEGVVLTGAVL
jgi:hypothetical protein